jgi:sigma-B regulation protein RsbU (phosphoserine phosphatase)
MDAGLRIRTLLVDDEEYARLRMRDLLANCEDVEIVGEARDGDEALAEIAGLRPDLVFLDIQMPGRSGLEVAASAPPPRPWFIYCTAFDQYALKAFETHALDYLLKPISRSRLNRALDRVREAFSQTAVFRREFQSAERTQARLMPQRLPRLATLDLAATCEPVKGVGGDYYDFLPLGGETLGIALGDVSGKGISAALLMAGLQGRLQALAAEWSHRLPELMARVNRSLCKVTESSRFVTFFYGVYRGGDRRLDYVNAGHLPPILSRGATGEVVRLDAGGAVLGVLEDAAYTPGSVMIGPGDTLVLFTDGISEATNQAGDEFGEQRLLEVLMNASDLAAVDVASRIRAAARDFRGELDAHDDLTLIVAKGI